MYHNRRRKKRPNYGTRNVNIIRGLNGFGFTITGQKPCILSCIVLNSPADLAHLRAGQFLIAVNGLNVSKQPHEAVAQLIGDAVGSIKISIAENYYSDSSDDENILKSDQRRFRGKYSQQKSKAHRIENITRSNTDKVSNSNKDELIVLQPETLSLISINKSGKCVYTSEIVKMPDMESSVKQSLEYNVVVGYLGTIEMPKQIATSSKLQTVRSCIRKIRQENRTPTIVLMNLLPNLLTLQNSAQTMLAKYPSSRLNYISNYAEIDNRFFGLVTSAMYANGEIFESEENPSSSATDIHISTSCHVFVVDTKLTDHIMHFNKANQFKITCTKDPISNLCLEFPKNSEYVVNLIKSMYTLKSGKQSICTNLVVPYGTEPLSNKLNLKAAIDDNQIGQPNSPQPSNHSEITTSSNSDSGIGFANDCANVLDRIVVVDFPVTPNREINMQQQIIFNSKRPPTITNDMELGYMCSKYEKRIDPSLHIKSKSLDLNTQYTSSSVSGSRLNVRAMPDKEFIAFKTTEAPYKITTKLQHIESKIEKCKNTSITSMKNYTFLSPNPVKKTKLKPTKLHPSDYLFEKNKMIFDQNINDQQIMSYKLSPKVYDVLNPASVDNLCDANNYIFSPELIKSKIQYNNIKSTVSEPDLSVCYIIFNT